MSDIKQISAKYLHPTGITANVLFLDSNRKAVVLESNRNKREFIFNRSKPETIRAVGEAFIELANFIDNL